MQQMQQLARLPVDAAGYATRAVQLCSQPYFCRVAFVAAPALFGPELDLNNSVTGELASTRPQRACAPLLNAAHVKGRIAVAYRGGCMFQQKARNVQEAGAIGLIVIDNTSTTSAASAAPFAMSGDNQKPDSTVLTVFMYGVEGAALMSAHTSTPALTVTIAANTANPLRAFNDYVSSAGVHHGRARTCINHAFVQEQVTMMSVCSREGEHWLCMTYEPDDSNMPSSISIEPYTTEHEQPPQSFQPPSAPPQEQDTGEEEYL